MSKYKVCCGTSIVVVVGPTTNVMKKLSSRHRAPLPRWNDYGDAESDHSNESFIDDWKRSGNDLVYLGNGDLFVDSDRIKDFLKLKSSQLLQIELERHLLNHPYITDAAVSNRIHDAASDRQPALFVVVKPALSTAVRNNPRIADALRRSILDHVSSANANYRWFSGVIEFVDFIPRYPDSLHIRQKDFRGGGGGGRARSMSCLPSYAC